MDTHGMPDQERQAHQAAERKTIQTWPNPVVIEITRRSLDVRKYHAQVKGKPGHWAEGNTPDEAIGDLIRCHPEEFNISLEYLEGVKR